jgi:hypothetical protein
LRTVSCLDCPSQCNCFCKNTRFLYIHVSVRTFYIYILLFPWMFHRLWFFCWACNKFSEILWLFLFNGRIYVFNPLQVAKEAILRVGNALRVYHKGSRVRILSTFIWLIHHLNPRSMDWPGMDNLQLAANVEGVPYHCSRNPQRVSNQSPTHFTSVATTLGKLYQHLMVTSLIIITFNQPPKLKPLCTFILGKSQTSWCQHSPWIQRKPWKTQPLSAGSPLPSHNLGGGAGLGSSDVATPILGLVGAGFPHD